LTPALTVKSDLFSAAGCSTVGADKGKPIERWGRKASGLQTHVYDSGVAV